MAHGVWDGYGVKTACFGGPTTRKTGGFGVGGLRSITRVDRPTVPPEKSREGPQKKAPRKLENAVISALHVNCEFGFELRIDYALSMIQRAKDEIGIK